MELEVNIDSAAVNKHVAEAILGSVVGEQIKKCIAEKMSSYTLKEAIQRVIDEEIGRIIHGLLKDEYADTFKDAVKASMSQAIVDDLAGRAIDKFIESRR